MNNREEKNPNKTPLTDVLNAGKRDEQNNPFLELPREMHRQIFSFLYKQDVARIGRVCKEMYRASRDTLVVAHTKTLPYEPLDYSASPKIIKKSFPAYSSLVSLSNGKVGILQQEELPFYPLVQRVGSKKVCVLSLDENNEFEKFVLADGNYFAMASFADNLFAAKVENGLSVVDIWDLNKPIDQQYISQVNIGNHSFFKIVGLSTHTFATMNHQAVHIWDFTREAGQQCIKIFPQLAASCSSLVPLSDTQFICASNSAQAPSTIKVYDISQPDGQECIKEIAVDTDVRNMTMLSNGLVAYMSFRQHDPAVNQEKSLGSGQIAILDLTKSAGQERIKVIKVSGYSILENIVALPNGYFATFTTSGWMKVFNLDLLLKNKESNYKQYDNEIVANTIKDLILLANGEIVLFPLSGGTPTLLKFTRLKPESDKSIVESIKEEIESRCSIM